MRMPEASDSVPSPDHDGVSIALVLVFAMYFLALILWSML